MFTAVRTLALLVLLGTLLSIAGAQSPEFERLASIDLGKVRLKPADLAPLDGYELRLLRGAIFGRHGRTFKDWDTQSWLEEQGWYKPNPKFSNRQLNPVENANLDLVRGEEARKRGHVSPGDMRFWRDRELSKKDLEDAVQMIDVWIMRNEIEAIHGKRFPDQPALQRYFEERYWYRPSAKYDPQKLGPIERKNLEFLNRIEMEAKAAKMSPWDVQAYQDRPLPASSLRTMSLYELRLARNLIYAMRGHRFQNDFFFWVFDSFEWYQPLPKGRVAPMTRRDHLNVAAILRVEDEKRHALSTKRVTREDLRGLFAEDLRRLAAEIEARRGKTFTDRGLKSYFAGMTWYKPDPKYRPSLLTKIERENLAFIQKAQKETAVQFDLEEG
jgi:hypothetical protein